MGDDEETDGGMDDSDGGMAMSCYDEDAALVAPGDSVELEQEECTERPWTARKRGRPESLALSSFRPLRSVPRPR